MSSINLRIPQLGKGVIGSVPENGDSCSLSKVVQEGSY